jgi:hypothetical protein
VITSVEPNAGGGLHSGTVALPMPVPSASLLPAMASSLLSELTGLSDNARSFMWPAVMFRAHLCKSQGGGDLRGGGSVPRLWVVPHICLCHRNLVQQQYRLRQQLLCLAHTVGSSEVLCSLRALTPGTQGSSSYYGQCERYATKLDDVLQGGSPPPGLL